MIKNIFLFLLIPSYCSAQTIKLSGYEKRWALFHPFAALTIKKINKQVSPFYNEIQPDTALDSFNTGGKTDAFRHVFFMAAFAQKVKVKKLRKLGIAHEKANHRSFLKSRAEDGEVADSLACAMDLFNNELGYVIGVGNKKLNPADLKKQVIEEIKKGKAIILKRDVNGNYLDCQGQKIDLTLYVKKWFIPKCLVPSNNQGS